MPRAALVASIDPWTFHLWCGNASLWVPIDLDGEAWVARYVDEVRPAFLVLDATPGFAALRSSPRWDAPPPLGRL